MKYSEIRTKLRKQGCQEIQRKGGGSHRKWINPKTDNGTVLPDWGAKDIKLGTIRAAIRQLGLDWKSFLDT
jgi:mRNA interferase HicA